MRIRKVLFATDFSERSEGALPHALWYAREFEAELHMLHAVVLHADDPANPDVDFPDLEDAYREVDRWASDRMEATAGRADEAGAAVKRVEKRGIAAAPVILDYAQEESVDLIVLATHGRRGVRRMLLGSVAEEVVRRADRPVLTVRADGEGKHGEPPRRILVPVDFSEHARRALLYGEALSERTGAELHVVHVLPEMSFPDPYFAEAAQLRAMAKAAQERVPEALDRNVREVLGAEVKVHTHLEVGSPAGTIVRVAEREDVDHVVLSSHGRTGVERVFLGSVAEGVVRRAPCPVLTVKAFGRDLLVG
ncbi:MAG: universal stress protein [Gemmatimonadota bacterium]